MLYRAGLLIVAAAALLVTLVWGYLALNATDELHLDPADAGMVAQGMDIYMAECAACHGAALEGQPDWQTRDRDGFLPAPPHDEGGHTWHHPDEILFAITKFGVAKAANIADYKSRMPAYEGILSDDEIVSVLSWIKAQWPAEIQRRHDELNARFEAQKPK